MSPSAAPDHPRPKPVAKRKGARRPLPAATAPNRSRKACAFLCRTISRKVPQIQQACEAPPRGLRLPGKQTPPLHRRPASSRARARATRTQPRSPDGDGTLHTPPSESPKALANTSARVPPEPQGHARPTASFYLPSLPLPAAICTTPCSSRLTHPNNFDLTSHCDLLRESCTINRVLTSASIEATVAAGRDASVTREISWSSGKKICYVSICWAPLKQALRIGLSGSGQGRHSRFCATWPPRGGGTRGASLRSFCGQRASSKFCCPMAWRLD